MKPIADNIKLATSITSVTLVGFFGEFPMERGNCFSVMTADEEYRIVNFGYENLKELIRREIVAFPVQISDIGSGRAIVADGRIPDEWYSKRFCETCCPTDLLPAPQRLKHFLDIERGIREEREIEIDGKKMTMVSIKVGKQ